MISKKCYKIYLIGIGGQGTIKTATIIGEAAMSQGLNVVMSEVHGMAQRGGTVVTEMKIGQAESPLIERNAANLVLAFEPSEILRTLDKIGEQTQVIANSSTIVPFTVSLGISTYPEKKRMLDKLKKEINNFYLIDAEKLAKEAGHLITANIVILGAALAIPGFPISRKIVIESVKKNLPVRMIDINLKALELGYKELFSE
ncbi:MAG: indolepyruvate ferredoxin oxidoreductase subunit beta [Atribacterota bacterium]|nr:indolepyruvate ferredoxin oxidoreductase subunit beta [Atribacterota bacterium]MDD3031266.1 indolepyruvate ferredoxin oxidoreductase subunit beta [Atribacterota bacterium]MDD3641012.1 indolepyruvate ferredoxin oxidoreductase subunit beta [Atribacterota bacterium]MDD4288086.1 indolepyruvate ferredoxin oxidoreductase subunit beta [Atribacterota bacterium]MDD5635409.1 indolepyruvate ferredoxin oxidoreductase subunit beta [Atribacterota bacterium]